MQGCLKMLVGMKKGLSSGGGICRSKRRGNPLMKRSCFLTDIVFHSNDNYQKTLDHPSYIMKACQIAHEYIS